MEDEDDEFNLFGELSAKEKEEIENRQKALKEKIQDKLNGLAHDRLKRSMAENRMVFTHQRQSLFAKPGIHRQLLSLTECQHILEVCERQTEWTTDRHSAFATTDIPIRSDPQLAHLEQVVKDRLFPELAEYYEFKESDIEFRDIFLVKYNVNAQKGLKIHTDGCLFSLTLLVSNPNDFEGGGTYYQSIDQVLHLGQGDVAYHDARVMHSGIDITKGSRYILVAFIDTVDTIEKDKRANKTMLRN